MNKRDIGALTVAAVVGFIATFVVYLGAYNFAHIGAFLMVSLFSPLLVSLIAAQRIILIAVVPNIVMTLCLTVWLVFFSPDSIGFDLVYVVSVMFGMSILTALLVSVP